jgi:hypothetical protein
MNGHDRNSVKEKALSQNAIGSEAKPDQGLAQAKGKRTPAKKAKTVKKARPAKKTAGIPKADRGSNHHSSRR